MPPKMKLPSPFPGAKGQGTLQPLAAGVIFGMLFGGKSVREVAALMSVTRQTVYSTAKAVAEQLGVPAPVNSRSTSREASAEQEECSDSEEPATGRGGTPLAKLAEINARRAMISEVMGERDEEGNFVVNSAREVARRMVERGVVRSPRTMSRDLVTMGLKWLVRPATADMTEVHLARRVAMADDLLSVREEDILFFMQDGAPAHSSRATIDFLRENGVAVLPWPSKSPDLNPIENIWSLMKRNIKVERQRKASDLKRAIVKVWQEISQDEIDHLCLGFHARVAEMQRRSGEDCQIPSRLLK